MAKSYDLFNMVWAVHDIPADVDYDDSIFVKQFESKFGQEPEAVIRERYNNVTRVYVGPVENVGPMVDMLRAMKAAKK